MKAMLLAAGEGRRMRPLTLTTPKPLLKVAGKALIVQHLEALRVAGIRDVVINVAYLGTMIEVFLGDGEKFGVNIAFSREDEPLETAGGIVHAHALLGDEPFLLLNGDVWTDFPLSSLISKVLPAHSDAHLVLVDNPEHHPEGDFVIGKGGKLQKRVHAGYTYSGVALIRPAAVLDCPLRKQKFPLRDVFSHLISQERITAEYYDGDWIDVGTPERLQELEKRILARS